MKRAVLAEYLGSLVLTATVVGSGIMAERLSGGNVAVALLGNTWATVCVLAVLIVTFASVSGSHFNPVVSLCARLRGTLSTTTFLAFVVAQVAGCCTGAVLANVMFDTAPLQLSSHARTGMGQWLGEWVATAGLVVVAFTSPTFKDAAWRVPAWIGAAYWFTSSTSFANPAITVGRALSDSFAGIRPADVPAFVAAQFAGALVAYLVLRALADRPHEPA